MMEKEKHMYLNLLNINIYRLTTCLILCFLGYVSGLSSNDEIVDFSAFTSTNFSVTKATDAIIDGNGSTKNLDSEIVPGELSIHHNDFKITEYIDSVCMDIFAPWEPYLIDYSIIKHINEEISYIIYFTSSKYSVKDGYDGDGYSLLCNNIATTALKNGYCLIINGYYPICGSIVFSQ